MIKNQKHNQGQGVKDASFPNLWLQLLQIHVNELFLPMINFGTKILLNNLCNGNNKLQNKMKQKKVLLLDPRGH